MREGGHRLGELIKKQEGVSMMAWLNRRWVGGGGVQECHEGSC